MKKIETTYHYRVEGNLLNATVSVARTKKEAIRMIKKNPIDLEGVLPCSAYKELGIKGYPAPNEIIEVGFYVDIKRYKV